eukprot:Hpha_TRINITY_DN15926_c1_g1::TRINITY_DN15926_c1_g1_i11::g.75086::m.75086
MPSASPTLMPTPHACNDGSHGCHDLSDGGICIQNGAGWQCDCDPHYWCSNGCTGAHIAHTCIRTTAGPTSSPTALPTTSPTVTPTDLPTTSPTAFPTESPSPLPTVQPTTSPTTALPT